MAQENEASVEEILESIKKVIARDNRKDARKAHLRRERQNAPTTKETAPQENTEEVLELSDMQFADDEPEETVDPSDSNAPLIAEETRGAMQENLAALAMLAEPGAKPQIVRSGETSLEGLTRELLRPMLAEWLDKNLPGMVESMVQAEIARIAGKQR